MSGGYVWCYLATNPILHIQNIIGIYDAFVFDNIYKTKYL